MAETIIDFYGYIIFFYSLALMVSYVVLMTIAYRGLFYDVEHISTTISRLLIDTSPYTPGVSIIAPAFNEEKTIIDNVNSLLGQDYPKFEVIIVNDGSKDSTLDKLITYFEMERVPYAYREAIYTQPFKALYRSTNPKYARLIVVDKVNGGTKADPINCGLNVASYPYFVNTDVDCILTNDALYHCMMPIMKDSDIVGVSAMMTMSNGCEVEHGVITKLKPPKQLLPLFQELEYLRSFIVGKMGWSGINAMSNVSGGFGFFNRDIVISAGGYTGDSFAEDMDMLINIVGYCRENNIPYRVVQIPHICCRTEGPSTLKVFARQRTRWGRGLIQTFHRHFKKMLNPKYGRLGMITLPHVFLFEFLAPLIELLGFFVFLYLALSGGVNWKGAVVIFLAIYLFCLTLGFVVVFFSYHSKTSYRKFKQYLPIMAVSFIEPFIYHPLILFFSLRGYFNYLTGKKATWGVMTRRGFASTDNPAEGTITINPHMSAKSISARTADKINR